MNQIFKTLRGGAAIPAMPLALSPNRQFDERRQRALIRYYDAAGAGGLAVGVHTTQFEIREPRFNLHIPVLELAAEELDRADSTRSESLIRVAGICGPTEQATKEAELAKGMGYHIGLLSLAALRDSPIAELIQHCHAIAEIIPIFGFYLQPAVGGRELPYSFWRQFAEIDQVKAIKIAAFDRYQTLDVVRAIVESGRDDIALYTGNDDNIVMDLLTPFRFNVRGTEVERNIVGGLLGHWSVWTRAAVRLFDQCRSVVKSGAPIPQSLVSTAAQVTDCNAAFFDAANSFDGCIPGLHEVLRRQGFLSGVQCLDEDVKLSRLQALEIDRVCRAYPHLSDDDFVKEGIDRWMSG